MNTNPVFAGPTFVTAGGGNGHSTIQLVPVRGGGGSGGGSSGGGSSGHSSGGGSGFHSSGGGTSIGGFGGLLFVLIFFGVFAFIIVAAIRKNRNNGMSGIFTESSNGLNTVASLAQNDPVGNVAVPDNLVEEYVALKAKDPAFTMSAFDDSARRVFYAVQTAWCDRQPGGTRKVMADKIWQSHTQQINMYTSAGTRNRLDGLAIQYTTVQNITTVQDFENITVRFFVDSADYDVDDKGKVVRGDTQVRSWCEDWTFSRSENAATVPQGIAQNVCPNCGAGLDVDTLGNCNYCHAAIMGGAHDWVLSSVSQLSSLENGWMSRGVLPETLDEQAGNTPTPI